MASDVTKSRLASLSLLKRAKSWQSVREGIEAVKFAPLGPSHVCSIEVHAGSAVDSVLGTWNKRVLATFAKSIWTRCTRLFTGSGRAGGGERERREKRTAHAIAAAAANDVCCRKS